MPIAKGQACRGQGPAIRGDGSFLFRQAALPLGITAMRLRSDFAQPVASRRTPSSQAARVLIEESSAAA